MSRNVALESSAMVIVNEGVLPSMRLDFKKESFYSVGSVYLRQMLVR